jgi:hypothetical protein
VAPDEKTEAKTNKPHRHKAIARQRNNYGRPRYGNAQGAMPTHIVTGHSAYGPTGDHHFAAMAVLT